jgi:hypothetical protein
MGKDSGNDTQQTQSSSAPWGPQAKRWQTSLNDLDKLRASGALRINPYPGQTVAPTSQETANAWTGIANRAQSGSPLNQMSGDYVRRTLDPGYLMSDSPGLSNVLDSAANDVNSRFAMAGRTFSGGHANALNQSQGQLRYQDFARKAQEQQAAAQFAPQLAREDYFDLNQLQQVGGQREAAGQDLINADINRFNALQNAPINELALYQKLIGGNLGANTTATQPNQNAWGANQTVGLIGGLGQAAASVPWWEMFGGATA